VGDDQRPACPGSGVRPVPAPAGMGSPALGADFMQDGFVALRYFVEATGNPDVLIEYES